MKRRIEKLVGWTAVVIVLTLVDTGCASRITNVRKDLRQTISKEDETVVAGKIRLLWNNHPIYLRWLILPAVATTLEISNTDSPKRQPLRHKLRPDGQFFVRLKPGLYEVTGVQRAEQNFEFGGFDHLVVPLRVPLAVPRGKIIYIGTISVNMQTEKENQKTGRSENAPLDESESTIIERRKSFLVFTGQMAGRTRNAVLDEYESTLIELRKRFPRLTQGVEKQLIVLPQSSEWRCVRSPY